MKKILVIRFSSIGDIVLTSPVLRCLQLKYPDAEIHFLSKKTFEGVLNNYPYIHKLWLLEVSLTALIQKLKKEAFDFVVDLHKNIRSEKVKRALAVPSGTFNKLNAKKWLLTNFKINKLPKKHIVDRYFKAVKTLEVSYDGNGLDFFIEKKDKAVLDTLPQSHQRFYVLVIGAAHFTKSPSIKLCVDIVNRIKRPIILIGGKDDLEKSLEIEKQVKSKECLNLVGKTTIGESAALLLKSKVVITPDTGMMHIAAALNRPIVCIWGNTVPEFGMYPFYPNHQSLHVNIQNKKLSCRPCSKIGFDACPKKHFKCINDLSAEQVVKSVRKLRMS